VVAVKVYRRPPNAHPDWPDDGTWLDITDQAALLQGIASGASLVRVREAFLGKLTSPDISILNLNAVGRHAFRTPVLVMEWLDGRSLADELRTRRSPVAERITWIRQLAQAIELIHSVSRTHGNPLVHTDIKPGNCMITPGRGLVLVDTGAMHRASASRNRRGLRTPPYAAPEVLADPGRPPSSAGDLYSLGAVAYHVLTGEAPPESGDPGYLTRARTRLDSLTDIGPGHTPKTRRLITEHVLVLLDPDPARRAQVTPTAWADQLGRLIISRRRVRVAMATSGASLLLVVFATLGFLAQHQSGQPPASPSRTAGSSPRETSSPSGGASTPARNTRQWDTLPLAPALGKLAFASSFSGPATRWPATSTTQAVNRYAQGGYVLHPLTRSTFDVVTAPSNVMTSVETVTATASLQGGQGIWGVWCRGTDSRATQSYQFWISHAGSVSIVTPQGQTPWVYLQGIDVSTPTTLSAQCADANPGPVQLTLSVNGRQVLTQPVSGTLLGPGYSGIEAAGFSDVAGPIAQIRFTRYAIYEG
jgi:serine/threonine protein kinase